MSAIQPMLDFDRRTFSEELSQVAKFVGMRSAAMSHKEVLEAARNAVRLVALSRTSRTATADDAQNFLVDAGLPPLGPAAGSLFLAKDWAFTGQWQTSTRVSNHGHQNRVWRLK
jgi:hypothetical protein